MTLRRRTPDELVRQQANTLPDDVRASAAAIVERVRREGEPALRELAVTHGDRTAGEPLYLDREALDAARDGLSGEARARLSRIARRIRRFAEAQRAALSPVTIDVPGGTAGHEIVPVRRAGCYAPGGRYPLPSSVLMTALTARVAGVDTVWVASPRPAPITLAAAAVAGADGVLAVGGAQAVAALAYGCGPIPPCDIVVGPGNRYVTAAKQLLTGTVGIDMLAGPSELVVVADDTADPALVAADLLAQAEHDDDALPILVTASEATLGRVEAEIERQMSDLPTAATARAALANGGVVLCASIDQVVDAVNAVAPEHLELTVADPDALLARLDHYGAVFVGEASAEVFGDYGAGPNHVLPTGRSSRVTGGLSVLTFLRVRTWMRGDPQGASPAELIEDVAWLARQEGLEAHARAAERRRFRD